MLDSLHSAIIARLTADLTGLGTCALYPKLERRVVLPAVLVELTELEPDDFGDEQFGCYANFTAYCIYDPNATDAEKQVRNLAATVAVRVSQEDDFGLDVQSGAEILRVGEDGFKPELDGYLVWAVDFRIGLLLGENVWSAAPATGASVATITVGSLNSVGITHVIADGHEPPAVDEVSLPATPKG